MARPRHIDRKAVLQAAERVIIRDGAARLTIEAVALEAGISKATVLYDYKTKQTLIRALIADAVATYRERLGEALASHGSDSDALIRTLLDIGDEPTSERRALVSSICDAVVRDSEAREPVRDLIFETGEMIASALHPRGLRLALLAFNGLKEQERLLGERLPQTERAQVMADIFWLAGTDPAPRTS
jgi:AcrR family transcriptional regulator